jgi:ubiquinone/menaquinone biosynthesis C-methylase UbiE
MKNQLENRMRADEMRLGAFEFFAMNNPLRRWVQKHIEFRIFTHQLMRNGIELEGKAILDAGCGSGYSTELIVNAFHPAHIVAFDYMPEQIRLARKRNLHVVFSVGDLTHIDAPDATFDAVFIFGVLHHIPEWRSALGEVSRVLKGDGVLLVDEPTVARFTWKDFESGMIQAGLGIVAMQEFLLAYFHAYLCRKTC